MPSSFSAADLLMGFSRWASRVSSPPRSSRTCLLFSLDFSLVSAVLSVRGTCCSGGMSKESKGLTRIGEVGLVSPDLRGDLLLALGELLHVVGHDRFGALGIHGW